MTKKDNRGSSNDFFSDISDDLKNAVSGLDEAPKTEEAPATKAEGTDTELFAVSDEASDSEPADLFDNASNGSVRQTTDATLVDVAPFSEPTDTAMDSALDATIDTMIDADALGATINTEAIDMEALKSEGSASETSVPAPSSPSETESQEASQEADEFGAKPVDAEAKDDVVNEEAQGTEEEESQTQETQAPEETDAAEALAKAEEEAAAAAKAAEEVAETAADVAEEVAEAAAAEGEAAAEEAAEEAEALAEAVAEEAKASTEAVDDEPEGEPEGVLVEEGSGVPDEQRPFRGSQPDTQVETQQGVFVLEKAIEHSPDRIVWEARHQDDETKLLLIKELSPARYSAGLQHFPELPQLKMHRPIEVVEQDERVFALFEPLPGMRLRDCLRDPETHWTIGQMRRFMQTLVESIQAIHEAGYICLQLDEHHIWIDDNRQPTLYDIEQLFNDRTPFHLRPISEGFSAPELYHHQLPAGPHSDVFSLGVLLHYMISQCPLFNHLDLPNPEIPSPRLYQLDFPVGLDHIIERSTHYDLQRRYHNAQQFYASLEHALEEIEHRHRQPVQPLQLSVGHDIHIGINKGMRNPVNQDALFWRYDRRRNKGLFLVADGVSHCHYGSGDRASSILVQAARQTWDALVESPLMDREIDRNERRRILSSIFATANRAISEEVNKLYDRVEGYVEDVMGSTCVGGFLDNNQLTVTNLGDSRAYLKTNVYIEQVSVDHDYKTAQLQVGQDVRSIQSLMGGSLITRCVGSCRKDEQLKVVPLKLQPDFFDITLIPGDTIIFCSDGLCDYAGETEEEAREMISKITDVHTEPISACFWLVALANQRGGGDNISVIEIKVLDTM